MKSKRKKQMNNFDKRINKKSKEELQEFLSFRKKSYSVPAKKGNGSYNRNKIKNIKMED